jgi:hypothetical protein
VRPSHCKTGDAPSTRAPEISFLRASISQTQTNASVESILFDSNGFDFSQYQDDNFEILIVDAETGVGKLYMECTWNRTRICTRVDIS